MKCPKCRYENPEDIKFCGECGARLDRICPSCNSPNPPQFKFCGECGHKFVVPAETLPKDLSVDEKIEKIQKYLPRGLAEKILSQKDRIEGERKQVTVMFCDLEGFTALSERLGPEEAYKVMDEIYEILIHKVHDYEGTVNEMTGDGIMALFGAPIALEDAPQRAIRSAYAIHREIARFSDRLKLEKENIAPLKMRIGIHTGPVVVGTLGNDLRVEFKAVGDTVNLASRMEGLAEPAATYVTEEIFKLTEGLFRFEALGEKEVKGKAVPVKIYRVIAPSTRRTRFDVSAERGLTPFIGRERELELLLDGFERVRKGRKGRGQAFSIMAEAGVGKSRLLYEFRKAVANEDVTFLEGKCLSYSRGVAYHPIIDVLKSNFEIQEGDADSEITEKVKTGLKAIGADEASTLPYLLELLSVKDSGIDNIPMSPEARKDRITGAVKRMTLRGSEIRPLIIAIEDLHWIDKGSEEYLKDLLNRISGAKVFLVFTYRPEFVHSWSARSYHSQVTLNRLSNRESHAMVSCILGAEDIDSDLEDLILEKTEGVPFFIEEFIKSLKELKIVERKDDKYHLARDIREVSIPSTIQDVVMARVDSLPEGAKEVLQTGSVIEREFSYELIEHVTGLSEKELLTHLSALRDTELIYERGIFPQTTCVFKHALTREVVYDSILIHRKKKLHEEIGNAIEALYQEKINEYYVVLAEHYFTGENHEKGAAYAKLVAENAEKAGVINDAIVYAKKRVASLEKLSRTDDVQKKIIDARTALGIYMIRMTYYSEAKEAVEPIIDLALKSDYKKPLPQILSIIGSYEISVEEDVLKAFKHLEAAVKISEELEDNVSLSFTSFRLGIALSMNCEFEKAASYYEKMLDIMAAANNLWGISVAKSYLSHFCYFFMGKINLAYQTGEEAVRLAEESGDIYSKAIAYTVRGTSCYGKGFLEEAIKYLLKSIDFCERINLAIWNSIAQSFIAEIYYEIGEYQNSRDHYARAVEQSGSFGDSWLITNKIGEAKAQIMMSEKDIDLESFYGFVTAYKIKFYDAWMPRYLIEILISIDDRYLSEVEDRIKKTIKTHKANGMMWYLAKDYALYAELFKRKGEKTKAKENLSKAIEIFKGCGADGWVEKTEEEMASLA
jgi:class 3 adenylate cyclase/tetratricopeptide (TPR) repeat protein